MSGTGGPVSYPIANTGTCRKVTRQEMLAIKDSLAPSLSFKDALDTVLKSIRTMLLEKNERYGNSALNPVRIFSKAPVREQILVRMDDKLSRIRTLAPDDQEDAIQDLIGYLILMKAGEVMDGTSS